MVSMISLAGTVRGQQASHWNCDVHAYQYDMTVYLQLKLQGKTPSNYADYEIAAFCEEECRGVATILHFTDKGGKDAQLARLRVRSNAASGEDIMFRVFQRSTEQEIFCNQTVSFTSQDVIGSPSAPMLLTAGGYLRGDVDGDGSITVSDITSLIALYLGEEIGHDNLYVCDMDGDGKLTVSDITELIGIYLGK